MGGVVFHTLPSGRFKCPRPSNPQLFQLLCGTAVKAGRDYPETFRLLQNAILADPYNPRYLQTLAFYYLKNRKPALAEKLIQEAAERGVSSPDIEALRRQMR